MTEPETEYERHGATRDGALELAAATLVNSVGSLMARAVRASGKQAQAVAEDMRVTPARITQLLAAKGNVKVSTLARFLDACGYEVKITAEPKSADVPRIDAPTRGRRPRREVDFALGKADLQFKPCVFDSARAFAWNELFNDAVTVIWMTDSDDLRLAPRAMHWHEAPVASEFRNRWKTQTRAFSGLLSIQDFVAAKESDDREATAR